MFHEPLPFGNPTSSTPEDDVYLLAAKGLSKTYRDGRWTTGNGNSAITGLQDVSLTVGFRQTLGVVGASGAGKSTLARCIACLDWPDAGQVWLGGRNLLALKPAELRQARRQIQMIFQGSAASLNPRLSAIEIITEPATIEGVRSKGERREIGLAMMESVGLPRSAADRSCCEWSGGQRQRLALARALSLTPKVLIMDESLVGLDLPTQGHLLNLLFELQVSLPISYIFISHDLRLVTRVADDIAVMYGGRIVEYGPARRLSQDPQHPHTRALLSAAARLNLHK